MPVQDVAAVGLADCSRAELRRVGARGVRLRHRERRFQLTVQEWEEPALLLLRCAGERDDLAVAGVGRLAAERVRREDRRAEDLVHQAELDLAEALTAELGRQVSRPEALLPDLLVQRRVDPIELGLADVVLDRLDRPDLLAHERAHPFELLFELRLGRKVPRHGRIILPE